MHALAYRCFPHSQRAGTQAGTEHSHALLSGSAAGTRVSPRGCWGRIATLLLMQDCIDRLARDAIATRRRQKGRADAAGFVQEFAGKSSTG